MIGTVVGGYRIDGKLGEGGMGEVFTATHELIGKRVAVKVLLEAHCRNADVVARFFKEARAIALLNHPGSVDVIDTGKLDDGRAYLVMSLLEGESLAERIARGRLPARPLIAIARQIADVLASAHEKGIVHRDLKPDNVFLVPDAAEAAGVRVKVLDFGVAKLSETGPGGGTNPAALIGTPAYMAPEQCRGAAFVDARSDIYSLGCLMFEMACGRTPFVRGGFGEYLVAHLGEAPPRPSTLAEVDARLERVILRALEKDKEARPASMPALIAELDACEPPAPRASASAATVVNTPRALLPPPRSNRALFVIGGLAAAIVAAVVALALVLSR